MTSDEDRHEPLAERLIRDAQQRGEFDDIDGSGEPIDGLDGPYDPAWWAKAWARRELVPPELRGFQEEVKDELAALSQLLDEHEVRQRLEALNRRIEAVQRKYPTDRVPSMDIEAFVQRWRRGESVG